MDSMQTTDGRGLPEPGTGMVIVNEHRGTGAEPRNWCAVWEGEGRAHAVRMGTRDEVVAWALAQPAASRFLQVDDDLVPLQP